MLYYIHGTRIDELISDSRGYCYHSDGLGSIVNLTDSTGAKANSYTYMAFGLIYSQSGTVSNPWLFTGRQYDSESSLYYYRNRYYDAKVGRFITRDPIGIAGGINLYQYCGNNPVNYTDPYGNIVIADDIAILGIIAGAAVAATTDWQAVGQAVNDAVVGINNAVVGIKDAVVSMSKKAPTPSGIWPPTSRDLGIIEPGDPAQWPKFPPGWEPPWWVPPLIVTGIVEQTFEHLREEPIQKNESK